MDRDILSLVGLAFLPVGGMLCGALAAERWRVPRQAIGTLLHAAAGVAVAVVSVELMPRILTEITSLQLVAGFLAGAMASVVMESCVRIAVRNFKLGAAGPWKVHLAVAIDLLADGIMIGIGAAVAGGLGLMLGLSQIIANIPGGFVTVSNLRDKHVPRVTRVAAVALLAVPVLGGAALGFWLLRDEQVAVQNMALAFVAGMLLLATIEDLVPEADAPQARRSVTTAGFAAGFSFFALISLHLG